MTNCPNCGAPITNDICAYCGTVFINPKEYEDLKKELQNAKFRASLEAQNTALINSINFFRWDSANDVRGLIGFGKSGGGGGSALMN